MVSYEEALKKVREIRPDYNHCEEREDAFIFSVQPEAKMSIGGNSVMVIMKKDGAYQTMTGYLLDEGGGKSAVLKEFDIEASK